jgi:hypothetical protein
LFCCFHQFLLQGIHLRLIMLILNEHYAETINNYLSKYIKFWNDIWKSFPHNRERQNRGNLPSFFEFQSLTCKWNGREWYGLEGRMKVVDWLWLTVLCIKGCLSMPTEWMTITFVDFIGTVQRCNLCLAHFHHAICRFLWLCVWTLDLWAKGKTLDVDNKWYDNLYFPVPKSHLLIIINKKRGERRMQFELGWTNEWIFYFLILQGKLFGKRLGQMELNDGKLPEANGETLIHFVQDCDKWRKNIRAIQQQQERSFTLPRAKCAHTFTVAPLCLMPVLCTVVCRCTS